jgi:hypothetical protein
VTAGELVTTASAIVEPGPVAGAPDPLIGARSIRADGADRAMVAAIPADRFGNPAPAGTRVAVTVVHPDESLASFDAEVTRTVGWTWVPSVTTAGDAEVVAAVDGMRSAAGRLVEVPGVPAPFALSLESPRLPADGTTLVTVASDVLVDVHGNRLLDGTAAQLRADYLDGTSSFQTVVTVAGMARATVEAPDQAGVVRVEMTVLGVTSRPLDLEFRPAGEEGGTR